MIFSLNLIANYDGNYGVPLLELTFCRMSGMSAGIFFNGTAGNIVWIEKDYCIAQINILSEVRMLLTISPKKFIIILCS